MSRPNDYIPDKRMYRAVLSVFERIDEYNEGVEQAVESVALYQHVRRDSLLEHVKLRIDAPRKLPAKKYRWFIVESCIKSDLAPAGEIRRLHICRSRNAASASAAYSVGFDGARIVGCFDGYTSESEAQSVLRQAEGRYAQ